ncbi:MAG: hypothetical protein EBV01_10895 [Betaproteobacteria bacterium]|nr:hypothetical protein [Betaproteobacteria bacterium]
MTRRPNNLGPGIGDSENAICHKTVLFILKKEYSMSQVETNRANINANRAKLYTLESTVMWNKASAYRERAMIEPRIRSVSLQ